MALWKHKTADHGWPRVGLLFARIANHSERNAGPAIAEALVFFRRFRKTRGEENPWSSGAQERIGRARIAKVAGALKAAGFSPALYRESNQDLRAAFPDDNLALLHFITLCGTLSHTYPITICSAGLARFCRMRLPSRFKAEVIMSFLYNLCSSDSDFWKMAPGDRTACLDEIILSIAKVASIFFMVGDSHSNLYKNLIIPTLRRDYFMIPVHILCTGSSARGLSNPASRSGAANRLAALSQSIPRDDVKVFFKFGQVDIEFVFNFDRLKRNAVRFDEAELRLFCEDSTNLYIDAISEYFGGLSVTVISIFPPALSDASWHKGYVNAHIVALETSQNLEDVTAGIRTLEIPSLADRTRHHAFYNGLLKQKSIVAGFDFFNDFNSFIGSSGTVDPIYISGHQGTDHHLGFSPADQTLEALLRGYFSKNP